MSDDLVRSHPIRLSDDAAHRLLARAIELDHSREAQTLVADLRAVALEEGISAEAFDAAVKELGAPPIAGGDRIHHNQAQERGFFGRTWNRLRGPDRAAATIGDAIVSNAIGAALFWICAFLLTRVTIGFGWQAMEITILFACAVGIGIAHRLRARLVEIGLMGMVAFQAAELAMHLMYGIRAVQGAPTHFAVIIAGTLGAMIGWVSQRRRTNPPAGESAAATASPDNSPARVAQAPTDLLHREMQKFRLATAADVG